MLFAPMPSWPCLPSWEATIEGRRSLPVPFDLARKGDTGCRADNEADRTVLIPMSFGRPGCYIQHEADCSLRNSVHPRTGCVQPDRLVVRGTAPLATPPL